MITNDRQYRITKKALERLEAGYRRDETRAPSEGVDPRMHRAMLEGQKAEIDDLREQLERYERLKAGRVHRRRLQSLAELPDVLIEARIAANLTQKQLAERLNLHEQQIQRYEATRYAGVSVERAQQIADVVGLRMTKEVIYPRGAKS